MQRATAAKSPIYDTVRINKYSNCHESFRMKFQIPIRIIIFISLLLVKDFVIAQALDANEQRFVVKDYKCEPIGSTYWIVGTVVNRGIQSFEGNLRIKLIDQDNDIVFQGIEKIKVEAQNGKRFSRFTSNGTCRDKKVLISLEDNGKMIEGPWENGKLISEKKLNEKKIDADAANMNPISDRTSSQVVRYELKPNQIKSKSSNRDAVAIIIGVQGYKRLAKADFADQDATKFAEYANRALGIPKEKIRLLTESDADQAALLKTFRNWLPINVNKGKTDVFVFYSGHGLPSNDGKSLYFLPHGVDQDLLDETAIDQKKIIAAIQSTQPKSVTMFVDSCYSGQSRNGLQLLAGAKPVALKNSDIEYPPEFTVFTASASDQISSASNDLQHGIFSFYLMKGMEGAADINKDGNITFGEMQQYLSENVQRQALAANRIQVPQLIGDANRVLVGK
jgi:hypothetical protein